MDIKKIVYDNLDNVWENNPDFIKNNNAYEIARDMQSYASDCESLHVRDIEIQVMAWNMERNLI